MSSERHWTDYVTDWLESEEAATLFKDKETLRVQKTGFKKCIPAIKQAKYPSPLYTVERTRELRQFIELTRSIDASPQSIGMYLSRAKRVLMKYLGIEKPALKNPVNRVK